VAKFWGDLPVVLIALPANEVSTRWFKAKLLPTDCSPIFPRREIDLLGNYWALLMKQLSLAGYGCE